MPLQAGHQLLVGDRSLPFVQPVYGGCGGGCGLGDLHAVVSKPPPGTLQMKILVLSVTGRNFNPPNKAGGGSGCIQMPPKTHERTNGRAVGTARGRDGKRPRFVPTLSLTSFACSLLSAAARARKVQIPPYGTRNPCRKIRTSEARAQPPQDVERRTRNTPSTGTARAPPPPMTSMCSALASVRSQAAIATTFASFNKALSA